MLGHVSIATTQVYERLRQLQNQGADGGGNPA
jgi:site-specific recombinase XerD